MTLRDISRWASGGAASPAIGVTQATQATELYNDVTDVYDDDEEEEELRLAWGGYLTGGLVSHTTPIRPPSSQAAKRHRQP